MDPLPATVTVREVKSHADLMDFIGLPERVHARNSNWLPPVYADDIKFFDPSRNSGFSHCEHIRLLAYQGSRVVGRVMGLIHKTYNALHNESTARFGYLECYDDLAISGALIASVEEWAKARGMSRVIGPYGFSDKDPQGLMVEGFDYLPILDSPCNLPYLVKHIEALGYTKEIDCLAFRLDLRNGIDEKYYRIARRIEANNGFKLIDFPSTKKLKPFILPVLEMVNTTYSHLYGFVPMEEHEMLDLANRYLPIINPKYFKVALMDGKMVAFVLGLPNFTRGLQRAKGRLFPLGIFHILHSMRRTNQIDLMLGAVESQYRGRGLEVALGLKLFDTCLKNGLHQVETHLVLETNNQMLSVLENANFEPHKRFRIYTRSIGGE